MACQIFNPEVKKATPEFQIKEYNYIEHAISRVKCFRKQKHEPPIRRVQHLDDIIQTYNIFGIHLKIIHHVHVSDKMISPTFNKKLVTDVI